MARESSPRNLQRLRKSRDRLLDVHETFSLHLILGLLLGGACLILWHFDIRWLESWSRFPLWLPRLAEAFLWVAAFWAIILALRIWTTSSRVYGAFRGLCYFLLSIPLLIGLFLVPTLINSEVERLARQSSSGSNVPDSCDGGP